MKVVVREASSRQDYEALSQFMGEYVVWLGSRYQQQHGLIAAVLDQQSLTSESASLPTMYGHPHGRAFIAVHDNGLCGCGAYRRLPDGACEMKRLFVAERFRGRGLARRLCAALISAAGNDEFPVMRLDTGRLMHEATALYRSLGFRERPPYTEYPSQLIPHLIFMELPLAGPA